MDIIFNCSFIYLHAIKGLNAIADVYPRETIQQIASRYVDVNFEIDYRLRVGEAFLQIIQRCGATLDVNSSIIVSKIFVVLRSPNAQLKSSALVLLSYIAELSPSSLTQCIFQIFGYIQGLLVHEKDTDQRRGALICIHAILKGLGKSFKSSFDASFRNKLLIQLDYIASTDSDKLSKYHAQNCVDLFHDLCFV